MHAQVEKWEREERDRFGVLIYLSPDEIQSMIRNLHAIGRDHDQHFHLSANGDEQLGDVEIGVSSTKPHNMTLTSLAFAPGDELPVHLQPESAFSARRVRLFLAGALGLAGAVACIDAIEAAFFTYATNDYRAILLAGVWRATLGMIAFHGAGVLARGRATRWLAAMGWLVTAGSLAKIASRLSSYVL
jgi:hypothetical protein